MENAYLLTIFLTFVSFSAMFLLLARKRWSAFLFYFAIAWQIEAARTAVLLLDASGVVLDEIWFHLLDLAYLPVTVLLVMAVYAFFELKVSRLALFLYLGLSLAGAEFLFSELGHSLLSQVDPAPEKVEFWETFYLLALIMIPGGIIRLLLGLRFLVRWTTSQMEGLFVAGLFFIIHGAGSLRVPFQWYFDYSSNMLNILWFLEILGLSVSSILLVLNRERAEREEAVEALGSSERRLASLIENSHGIAHHSLLDDQLTVTYMHGTCMALTGFDIGEFLENRGRSFRSIIHPEDRDRVEREIRSRIAEGRPFDINYRIITSSGQVRHLLERGAGTETKPGSQPAMEGYIADVSELREIQTSLAQANLQLSSSVEYLEQSSRELNDLLELVEMLQVCETVEEICRIGCGYGKRLFPDSKGCIFVGSEDGSTFSPLADWNEPAFRSRNFSPDQCWAVRRGQPVTSLDDLGTVCEHHLSSGKGHLCFPITAHGNCLGILHIEVPVGDTKAGPLKEERTNQTLVSAFSDQLGLALSSLNLRNRLKDEAIHDPLTGLFNRRFMREALEREISRAKRSDSTVGILLIDLDYFKKVNDSYGHQAGDTVLVEVAKFLKEHVRSGDIICRYGGEEFLVLLPNITASESVQMAERLKREISHLTFPGIPCRITASLGLSAFPGCGQTADEILLVADECLYQAKGQGRNSLVKAQCFDRSEPANDASSPGTKLPS